MPHAEAAEPAEEVEIDFGAMLRRSMQRRMAGGVQSECFEVKMDNDEDKLHGRLCKTCGLATLFRRHNGDLPEELVAHCSCHAIQYIVADNVFYGNVVFSAPNRNNLRKQMEVVKTHLDSLWKYQINFRTYIQIHQRIVGGYVDSTFLDHLYRSENVNNDFWTSAQSHGPFSQLPYSFPPQPEGRISADWMRGTFLLSDNQFDTRIMQIQNEQVQSEVVTALQDHASRNPSDVIRGTRIRSFLFGDTTWNQTDEILAIFNLPEPPAVQPQDAQSEDAEGDEVVTPPVAVVHPVAPEVDAPGVRNERLDVSFDDLDLDRDGRIATELSESQPVSTEVLPFEDESVTGQRTLGLNGTPATGLG